MNREHLGSGIYVELNSQGQIVLIEGETDDRDNFFPSKAIVLELDEAGAFMDYIARAMTNLMPKRSRR